MDIILFYFFFHSFHCSIAIFVNGDEKKWKEDVSSFFKLLVFEEDRKLKLNDHENKMNDYCTANIILNILNNLLFIKKKKQLLVKIKKLELHKESNYATLE